MHKIYNGELRNQFKYSKKVPHIKLNLIEQTNAENKYLDQVRSQKILIG